MKKIFMIHPIIKSKDDIIRYLCIKDEDVKQELVWDEIDPDYIIASEHIYTNPYYWNIFLKHYKTPKNCIYIFHGGESVYTDLNIFDYGISYSDHISELDRLIKIPENYFFFDDPEIVNDFDSIAAKEELKKKSGFCSFIYSNPHAHPNRDMFFHMLSSYKTVASLGKHFNNTNIKSTRTDANWLQISIEQKSNYKFCIAFENESFNDYTTEKLLSSFRAHTVPIYWGNHFVAERYNPKAFINCHDYGSFDDVIKKVKEIDENDELWIKMIAESWQTEAQRLKSISAMEKYQEFWRNIILNAKENAVRRPKGTWTDNYYSWFFRQYSGRSFLERGIRKVKHTVKEIGNKKNA